MRKKEPASLRVARALDVPLDVISDVPRIEFMGHSSLNIENFRGILEYSETCIKVNTTVGIVEISGEDILIESITDEGVTAKGKFTGMRFI